MYRVAIAIRRIQLDRLPEHLDEFRAHLRDQAFVSDHRPGKRPFRQLARQQPVQHQSEREDVGLKLGAAHGLLRRNVIDGAGARRLERTQADLGEPEVAELQLVTREQDVILGLDVTVNDLVLVGMREGCDSLAGQVQRTRCRNAALDAIRKRLFAQLHRDHEVVIDIARVEHRQDVRVLQFRRNLDLVQEFFVPGVGIGPWYLQRDPLLLDRVVSAIHIGKRTGRYAAEDPVFTDFLSSS